MLLRWFRLRYVIEDTDAVWFDNALIKTNLIVAERIKRRPTAFDWQQETYTFVQISAAAANKRSVVGNVFPGHLEPEAELLEVIERGEEETLRNESQSIEIEPRKLAQKANMLLNKLSQSSWLMELESGRPVDYSHPNRNVEVRGAVLRSEILTWLTEDGGNKRFTTLESLGVQAGQGLRTGANRFFYVDIDIAKNITSSVTPNPMFNMGAFTVPSNCLQIVLRKQAELDEGLLLEPERLRGRAMVLTEYILPADMDEALPYPEVYRKLKQAYRPMPEELAEYVKNATKINLGTLEKPKYIPHMSAVRTNVRSIVPNNPEALPRFWYMLPPFTKRHRSDLFIPRVNHKHPRTYINSVQPVLIDANFSTLWLDKNSSINVYSLLALMNSTWCVVNMELQALIMGGGALKLEATHLRKLPIPELPPLGWEKLEGWGRALAKGNYNSVIIKQIDLFLMMTLFDDAHGVAKLTELENMSSKLLEKRVR
jgi:hypothetical protein